MLMAPPGAPELPTLEDLLRRPDWHQKAACRGQGTHSFFSGAPDNLDRARAVCAGCPVREQCYQYAMADPDLVGVWAGITDRERRALRRSLVA